MWLSVLACGSDMRIVARLLVALLALVGLAAVIGAVFLLHGGTSARSAPGRLESAIATRLRAVAIPREAEQRRNPVAVTPDVLREGMEHFADHCAACHANDGSGHTEMGRGLYPRPPDLRQAGTQSLSDGALFYIIDNGVRFTGMPAWSHEADEGADATWHLVHFIRHLPTITNEELARMRELNPKTPDEDHAGHQK